MGMFDTFYDENASIVCPHCSTEQKITNGVQSKHFDKVLSDYYVGSIVTELDDKVKHINDWVRCESCSEKIDVFFGFKNQIFIGIFQSMSDVNNASRKFDIYDSYKKLFLEKEKFEKKSNSLISKISDTIEIHGKKPVKTNFGFLFSIHSEFIDYDIIKTLKNILNGC